MTIAIEDELRLLTPAQAAETLAVSRKTVDDVVEEYARFHHASEEESRSRILAHAPAVEEDGIGPIRIRLVAGSFGPAVTSVVLWLRDYDLDVGCIQLTARLLDGESAMLTSRQLLPLPVTEDYVVRRRRREQEQEVRARRSRGANTVLVLAEAGLIEEGTLLRLGLETLNSQWRSDVERLLEEHPDMGIAEWNGTLTARSMRWRFDGEVYSLTGLMKRVLQEAGVDPPDAIPGPDYWLLPNGTAMYPAAAALRDGSGTSADS